MSAARLRERLAALVESSTAAERAIAPRVAHDAAYRGLVKLHAHELARRAEFEQTGRIDPQALRAIAADLALLDREHPLEVTVEQVIAQADALRPAP